jgi:hypothetical protein
MVPSDLSVLIIVNVRNLLHSATQTLINGVVRAAPSRRLSATCHRYPSRPIAARASVAEWVKQEDGNVT